MLPLTRGTSFPAGALLRRLSMLALPVALLACSDSNSPGNMTANDRQSGGRDRTNATASGPVKVEIFAPDEGDRAGKDGIGWFVDLALEFDGDLKSTGFNGNQLTGPGVHNNAPPFPGNFAPGIDDRFPGLVVLISTTSFGGGSCQNLADLFNLTGPTNSTDGETEIWDTWIIGAAGFGTHVNSTLYVAEVSDLNHNGIHDDAPAVVTDSNHDGVCDKTDLRALGLDSEVGVKHFFIL